MKIRLRWDLPVDPRHGMTKGRVLEAEAAPGGEVDLGAVRWRVVGDAGEPVDVLLHEAVVVREEA